MCPMPDISCVICAYMEAPRIGAVLSAVAGHPLVKEIIVVDDGSTDTTAAVVSRFSSITLVRLVENQGKSRALAAGVS
jgi:glycosyltransferase involved in cell wall biosynthesis